MAVDLSFSASEIHFSSSTSTGARNPLRRCYGDREIHSYTRTLVLVSRTRSDRGPRKEFVHEDKHQVRPCRQTVRGRVFVSRHVRQSPRGSDDKHATQEAVVLPRQSSPSRCTRFRILSRGSSRPTPRTNRRSRENHLGIHSRSGNTATPPRRHRFFFASFFKTPSVSGHRARGTILERPDYIPRTKHENYATAPPSCRVAQIDDPCASSRYPRRDKYPCFCQGPRKRL